MKHILLLSLLAFTISLSAQNRYALSVQSYSSNYGGCWDVTTIIGAPDVNPAGGCGDKCGSWASASADGQREFVELIFPGPAVPINTIRVWENNAPGAIDTLYAWNPNTNAWVIVMQRTAIATPCLFPTPTVYTFTPTTFNVDRIRIAQNSPDVSSWNEIDAVGIDNVNNGGTISATQPQICSSDLPGIIQNLADGYNGTSGVTYQWQDSIIAGTWQVIGGAASVTYQPPSLSQTTWFRRKATSPTLEVAYSNVEVINVTQTVGDPGVFPLNQWNFYAFNINSLDSSGITYRGYYSRTPISFDTQNDWSSSASPSSAIGYGGCTVPIDNFSLYAKRKGFPTSNYILQIPLHDDGVVVKLNGVEIYRYGGCCNSNPLLTLGQLDANSIIEIRLNEVNSSALLKADFTDNASLNPGSVTGDETICTGVVPSAITNNGSAFGGSSTDILYQWQDSTVGGTWQNISSATAASYSPPNPLTVDRWYRRKAYNTNGDVAYTTVIHKTVAIPVGDPSVWPSNQWNFYGYDGRSIDSSAIIYRGYYNRNTLSFNTYSDYTSGTSPSYATGWQGCPVGVNNYTLIVKRKGFPVSNYIIQLPQHDDEASIILNGVELFRSNGCCGETTITTLGALDANSQLQVRLGQGGGGSGVQAVITDNTNLTPGSITLSQAVCVNDIPSIISNLSSAYGGTTTTLTYQWQRSNDLGSTWNNVASANAQDYQPPALTSTTWFRRKVTNGTDSAYSNVHNLNVSTVQGDTTLYPTSSWNLYAFNFRDITLTSASLSYRGYYNRSTLNFSTTNDYGYAGAPSDASGYLGCPVGADNHTVTIRRIGFPAGNYTMHITFHDDEVKVLKDGVELYSAGCCSTNPTITMGAMDANTKVEVRYAEGGSNNGVNFDLTNSNLVGGTIGSNQTICNGDIPALLNSVEAASGGSSVTINYQWQDSTIAQPWTNIATATSATFQPPAITSTHWYRRKATNPNSEVANSNLLSISVYTVSGDPSLFGSNLWRINGYAGASLSLTGAIYKGYYTISSQNFNTQDQWSASSNPSTAVGYQGCPLPDDGFTMVAKRKGFDGGTYQLTLTAHDDAVRIYKNGVQVGGDAPCCNTGTTFQLGDLGANDSLEIRLTEISGYGYLAINMAKTNQPVYDYVNNNCNSFFLTGVSTNTWYSILDNTNKLIVQVNPGTNNLGTVTVRIKHFGTGVGNIPSDGGVKYMPRLADLQSSIYGDATFGVPVKVRLFFKNTELDDYKIASNQPTVTINNLYVNHYDGVNEDCDRSNNANHGVTLSSVSGTYGTDAFYMETSVNSFSEFAVSGGIAVLPVTLLQFSASYANSIVQLQWQVAQQLNLRGYEIQRSNDGNNFVVAGWVNSRSGSSTINYTFNDPAAQDGINYYRLRLVDLDGRSVYSYVILINTDSKGLIVVSPNPFYNQIHLQNISSKTDYRILNMQGQAVQYGSVTNNTIVAANLSKGIYILELRSENGKQEIKIIKE